MNHPSFLQLDRHALGARLPEVETHVGGCEQCSGHLARVREPAPAPAALKDAVTPRPWWRLRMAWAFAPAVVLAALVVLIPDSTTHLRSKGGPELELFVKRGEAVLRWDSHSLVAPGDRLLLKVDPAGYTYTRVLGGEAVLFEGELPPDRSTPLPVSFKVDAAPGPEHLRVELSGGRKTDWSIELELPKVGGEHQ